MRYYVTADVHGYFDQLQAALTARGFFDDPQPHKLIVCGDLYDRGGQAMQLQKFILELLEKDQVILIRGNHEDLALQLLHQWHRGSYLQPHHHSNGTVDTLLQLTGTQERELYTHTEEICRSFLRDPYIQTLIPATVDYFETKNYIFVHGWIPCIPVTTGKNPEYRPLESWRTAEKPLWDKARWVNGMEAAHCGIREPGKTIVCGHWHCSFGHAHYEDDGGEFDNSPNFDPYYGPGIIALDACTPSSKKVNVILLEDDPL